MGKLVMTLGIGAAAIGAVAATTPSWIAFIAVTAALALAASLIFSVR